MLGAATLGFLGAASRASAATSSGTDPDINPAAVSTLAGDGVDLTTNGTGTSAEFTYMGGVVVVGGYAYVGTLGSIRKVDVSTGATTKLAGDDSATGCVDSGTAGSVRFGQIIDLATDGTSLYATQVDCGTGFTDLIRKVTIASGATATLTATTGGSGTITYAGGYLYTGTNPIVKIDASAGTVANPTFASLAGGSTPRSIVSDGTDLWVPSSTTAGSEIDKVTLSGGAVSTFVAAADSSLASRAVEAAGASLYVMVTGSVVLGQTPVVLRRYAEADGSSSNIAGAESGYQDGTATDAWFSSAVDGIASDGSSLFITDAGNFRLRMADPGAALPSALPSSATTNVSMSLATMTTFAGNSTDQNIDGTGTSASFSNPFGVVVVDGYAYVMTQSAIRKVSLADASVTTFAGDPTTQGCVDSSDHAEVRFTNDVTRDVLKTDGHYLYSLSQCGPPKYLRRTSLLTGATSTVAELDAAGFTVGPGGLIYYVDGVSSDVYSFDPSTAVSTVIASTSASPATEIAADADYLWVYSGVDTYLNATFDIDRVAIGAGHAVTNILAKTTVPASPEPDAPIGDLELMSAGSYLYGAVEVRDDASPDNLESDVIERFSKSDGSYTQIAGFGRLENVDGTGRGAQFGGIVGLASDGTNLWGVDYRNTRLRKFESSVSTDLESRVPNPSECTCGTRQYVDPVDAGSGNYYETVTDLTIPGRSPALEEARTYGSLNASYDGPFGYGWSSSYDMRLQLGSGTPASTVDVVQENDAYVSFTWNGSAYVAPPRVFATLTYDAGSGTYTFTRRAQEEFVFDSTGLLKQEIARDGFAGSPGVGVPAAYATTLAYSSGRLSTVTDAAGRTLTFSYGGNGKVSGIVDSTGRSVAYGYDGSFNLTDVTDVGGGNTHFTYDGSHLLLTARDQRGNTVLTNTFDGSGRALTQTDGLSRTTTFDYTTIPGSTIVTDANGNATLDSFTNNLVTSETKGYGSGHDETWTYTYDPTTLGVATVTDPNSHVTNYTWDGDGNLLTKTDALSHTTAYTYNTFDEPLTIEDANSVTTTNTYNGAGELTSTATPLVGAGTTQTTTYTYGDSAHPGDVTSITDPRSKVGSFTYDSSTGDLLSQTTPTGDKTTYTYNSAGQRLTMVAPAGNVSGGTPATYTTTYVPDAFGHVTSITDPLSHQTQQVYDADGNLHQVIDPLTQTSTYTYDAANELTTITRPDTTTLQTSYWPDGSLETQTDGAGKATSYAYTQLGQLYTTTDPKGRVTTDSYDPAGNLETVLDSEGRTTTYGYDNADRLTSISYSDGTTPNVAYTYDADNQELTMADGTGTTTNVIDSLHRLSSQQDGAGDTMAYGYDLANDVTSITYPGSKTVTKAYDDSGRLHTVTDWLTPSNTTTYAYDHDSNLTSETYPNSTVATLTPDAADELTNISDTKSGTPFASFAYTRNGSGLVTGVTATGIGSSESYGYSALDQLSSVNSSNYTFDSADNLTGMPNGTHLMYDDANEVCWTAPTTGASCASPPAGVPTGTVATTYSYGADGERTVMTPPTAPGSPAGPIVHYGYDQEDRLTAVAGAGYQTDVLASNPIAFWRLGETTLSNLSPAVDSSGNARPATYKNASGTAPTSAAAALATDPTKAVTFNGSTDYVDAGNLDVANLSTYTVEAWVKTTSTANAWVVSAGSSTSTAPTAGLETMTSGTKARFVIRDAASNAVGVTGSTTINDGNWHHIVGVRTTATSPNNTTLSLYVDGKLDATAVAGAVGTVTFNTSAIGAINSNGSRTAFFAGSVADVAYYTAALNATTVNHHYQAGKSNYAGSTPVDAPNAYWRLDESSVTSATDSSGHGNTGTYAVNAGSVAGALANETPNKAVSFNGTSQHMDLGSAAVPGSSTTLTMEAWINTGVTTSVPLDFLSEGNSASNTPYDLMYLDGSTHKPIFTIHDSGSGVVLITGTTALNDSTWHHVVGVRNGSSVDLYVDGALVASGSTTFASQTVSRTTVGALGRMGTTDTNLFSGSIDEAAFYPTALSAATIARQYYNGTHSAPVEASYTYNGDGMRTSKTVDGNTTNFTWDGAEGLPLLASDGTTQYIYGPGGTPLEQITNSTPVYYDQDQQGSTRALTDQSGNVLATYTTDAFGNPTATTGTPQTPLRYDGEYRDAETGFVYLNARYYDTSTSQFISVDPEVALTRSAYGYSQSDPLNESDPTGLEPDDQSQGPESTTETVAKANRDHNAELGWDMGRGRILPKQGRFPYEPKKGWHGQPRKNPGGQGWVDKENRVWQWDTVHKDHWDVTTRDKKGYWKIGTDGSIIEFGRTTVGDSPGFNWIPDPSYNVAVGAGVLATGSLAGAAAYWFLESGGWMATDLSYNSC